MFIIVYEYLKKKKYGLLFLKVYFGCGSVGILKFWFIVFCYDFEIRRNKNDVIYWEL